MDFVADGWPPKLIRNRLELTDQQITDVMACIETHRTEVETEYQTVLQNAKEYRQYWEERNRERLAWIAAQAFKPELARIREKLGNTQSELSQECIYGRSKGVCPVWSN